LGVGTPGRQKWRRSHYFLRVLWAFTSPGRHPNPSMKNILLYD
jgi:hypothetical protein